MKLKTILYLAALLYLFVASITYHPDNKTVLNWIASDFTKVWNIYEHTANEFGQGGIFNYPPMNFVLTKLEWPIAAFLGGRGYTDWLNTNNEAAVFNPAIFRYTLATKVPLILVTLLTGWLIYILALDLLGDEKRSRLAAALWWFNPVTVFSVAVMGQNDVLAVGLFLAGWLLLIRKSWWSIPVFGLAISTKSYPLIWLVFLVFSLPAWSYVKKIGWLAGSYIVYWLTTLPFRSSAAFQQVVLRSSINERFFVPSINIGQEEGIYLIPLLLFVLFIFTIYMTETTRHKPQNPGVSAWLIMVANLILLGFSHFHPQWFTWIIPFWAVWLVSLPSIRTVMGGLGWSVGALIVWSTIVLFFRDKFLTWGILAPLNPNLINLPLIYDFLANRMIEVSRITNSSHTMVAGLAVLGLHLTFTKTPWSTATHTTPLSLPSGQWSRYLPLVVLTLIGGVASMMIIIQAVPAPISVLSTDGPAYHLLTDQATATFTARENSLNRIEIAVKNPELQSQDKLMFSLYDEQSTLIYALPFSAANAGDPGIVRFDFPVVTNTQDKSYSVVITRTATGNKPVLLGMRQSQSQQLWIRDYYRPRLSFTSVVGSGFNRIAAYLTQVWGWMLGGIILPIWWQKKSGKGVVANEPV